MCVESVLVIILFNLYQIGQWAHRIFKYFPTSVVVKKCHVKESVRQTMNSLILLLPSRC
jgi:hypothetical protein